MLEVCPYFGHVICSLASCNLVGAVKAHLCLLCEMTCGRAYAGSAFQQRARATLKNYCAILKIAKDKERVGLPGATESYRIARLENLFRVRLD